MVGEQGMREICGRSRDKLPVSHVAPVLSPAPPLSTSSPTLFHRPRLRIQTKCRNNSNSSSSSSVRTPFMLAGWLLILDAGESAVGKSRCFPLSHISSPHLYTPGTHPPPAWSSDSSRISSMTTGKAPSEVSLVGAPAPSHRQRTSTHFSCVLDANRDAR